jgi:hypothetical protein
MLRFVPDFISAYKIKRYFLPEFQVVRLILGKG